MNHESSLGADSGRTVAWCTGRAKGTADARTHGREVSHGKVAVVRAGKPIAAVCHGPQLLIEADLVRGKKVTSWPSVRTDLKNAGAQWVDQQVVQDGPLITSRKPDDLEAFSDAFLKRLA